MPSRHLDIGCGANPRNPYRCDETHGVDIAPPAGSDSRFFKRANLSLERIPYPDSHFESVSAFDFLEHVPRVLMTSDGLSTRFPFIELMNEVHRVGKPDGKFYAVTPAWPWAAAFVDPTHVNFVTAGTWGYFCGHEPDASIYGFNGRFDKLRNEWGLHPEAFHPDAKLSLARRFKRWRRGRMGGLSHLIWGFSCVKPAA
ncbi:MAG: methyltransferase domain-containing protein [Betaproteobacteria bacterium]